MATVRIKGFVYVQQNEEWKGGGFETTVLPYVSNNANVWGVLVGPIDVPFELPEGLDLKAEAIRQKIAALEAEKAEASAEFARTVARINAQIANLQAIEFTPATAGSEA